MGAAVIGQEQSGKNRLLQGQGKEKELHSESGKHDLYRLKKSGKSEILNKYEVVHLVSVRSSWGKVVTFFCDVMLLTCIP